MATPPTRTHQALLTRVGISSVEDLYDSQPDAARSVISEQLLAAFAALDAAERGVRGCLGGLVRTVDIEVSNLDAGDRLDPAWIGRHATRFTEQAARLEAAIRDIQNLAAVFRALGKGNG